MAAGIDECHLFEDKASGAKMAALAYVKKGDCLVVWKLDRLGRSLTHLLQIVNELKVRGVGFRSLTEQMDTTTPHGEFLFNVFDQWCKRNMGKNHFQFAIIFTVLLSRLQ